MGGVGNMMGVGSFAWVLVLVAVLCSTACGEGAQVDVTLAFDTPELAAKVARIDLAVVPSCGSLSLGDRIGADAITVWSFAKGGALPDTSDADVAGRGLYAVGYDAGCRIIASACEAAGKGGGASSKQIVLQEMPGAAGASVCDDAQMCVAGQCVVATPDGGIGDMDAASTPDGSALDADVEAGDRQHKHLGGPASATEVTD